MNLCGHFDAMGDPNHDCSMWDTDPDELECLNCENIFVARKGYGFFCSEECAEEGGCDPHNGFCVNEDDDCFTCSEYWLEFHAESAREAQELRE